MAQAESNRVDIRFSEETVWNETPSAPTMASLPYVSEGLVYNKRSITSQLVRSDRLIEDIIEVGAGSGGPINFEYKFGDFDKLIEGALGSVFATATFTGSAGNLDIAASGAGVQVLTAPAATWNSYVVGAYVRVSGANANNNGVFRITAKTSTTLTINNATGTLQNDADGATVLMKYIRTGTTKKSYLVEKHFADINQFISFRGCRVGTWAMDVTAEQIITGSFGLLGAGAFPAGATVSGSVTPAGALSVCGATSNMGRIEEGGVALTTKVKSVKFNLNANPRQLTAIANKFPIGINLGSFDITGSVEAYFEDLALYNKFINHTDSSLVFEFDSAEDDRTIITISNLKFTNAQPVGAGLNQDVTVMMDFTAKRNATDNAMMQVDLLT
jgi:hypothetical protein